MKRKTKKDKEIVRLKTEIQHLEDYKRWVNADRVYQNYLDEKNAGVSTLPSKQYES